MKPKTLFALDFDGVICNSAVETAITGWKAAQSIWADMNQQAITDKHIEKFSSVRPCLEFGYEAILIMRLLQRGKTLSEEWDNYHQELEFLISENNLNIDNLKELFGKTRDREIAENKSGWIASNPLSEGIAEKLKELDQEDWVIVTTKQERFVSHILQGNGLKLDEDRIFGLDRKLSKQDVLKNLKSKNPNRPITFIEDRLPTLVGVQQNPDLQEIKLQLVDWGFNTEAERKIAKERGIEIIKKEHFLR